MQRTHRTTAWLIGLVLIAAACSDDDSPSSDTTTTLPDFTSVITAGPELTGSAQALDAAVTLAESGRMADAIVGFDDVISRFSSGTDLDTRRDVVDAYFQKALTQTAMGNGADAVDTYAAMAANTADNADLEITETLSLGLVNRGNVLIELGRFEEARDAFDEVLNRFGARSELEIQFTVIGAALGKADALVNIGTSESIGEAIFIYDAVVVEAGTKQEPAFESMQVAAIFSKGRALQRGGAFTEAAANFNFVLDAWTGNTDGTITQLVGLAQEARAELADVLNQPGVPGTCLILEQGACVLRDRFPTRPNVTPPFLPHIVAFNLPAGTSLYVPYDSEVVGPEPVQDTEGEVIVTFSVAATEEVPENRCTVQFVPDGPPAISAGPAAAGTLVGAISDERLSAPAASGFIYNLTISCLFRDPADQNRFGPDLVLIDQLFGSLPTG